MFELRTMIIMFLLCATVYYVYNLYSYSTHIVNKASENVIDTIEDKFDDIDEKFVEIDSKLQAIEDLITVRLEICYKRVNEIYSLQNKVNEITKMNNQSIIHQINQYDEQNDDNDINKNNQVYNSIETSMSPVGKNCFVKHSTGKNADREMFYVSSNKNNMDVEQEVKLNTELSKVNYVEQDKSVKSIKSTKSEKNIFSNMYKNKKQNISIVKDNLSIDNDSNIENFINSLPDDMVENFLTKEKNDKSSVILEMNSDDVKPCQVLPTSKFVNAMKILNETNLIKNNSYNKLNEMNNTNIKCKEETSTTENTTKSSSNSKNSKSSKTSSNSSNYVKNNFVREINLGENSFVFAKFEEKPKTKGKVIELS